MAASRPPRLLRPALACALATGLAAGPLHAEDPLPAFPINAPIVSQWSFSTPWQAFFDTTREVKLFGLYDCADRVRLYATEETTSDCIGVRAERGYEAATGQGALRLLIAERQVRAGVVGGPAVGTNGSPQVIGANALGNSAGIFFFALSGETVIRPSPDPLFLTSNSLATLFGFSLGFVDHYHRFIDYQDNSRVALSTDMYLLRQVSAVTVPGGATSTVPEPGTWALLGTGLLAVGGLAHRRRGRATA
jgi:hypothetical protein